MLAAGPAAAEPPWPGLYSVTGVAGDDTLNIRAAPSAGAEILGSYGPRETGIEVTGQDDTGGWLRVNIEERAGWVAARFMEPAEKGDYALARAINCFGTEPFWSLDLVQGAMATLARIGKDPQTFRAGLVSRAEGRPDRHVVGFGEGLAVLSQRTRTDGMSDRVFALEASVLLVEDGLRLYAGCCSIQPD